MCPKGTTAGHGQPLDTLARIGIFGTDPVSAAVVGVEMWRAIKRNVRLMGAWVDVREQGHQATRRPFGCGRTRSPGPDQTLIVATDPRPAPFTQICRGLGPTGESSLMPQTNEVSPLRPSEPSS